MPYTDCVVCDNQFGQTHDRFGGKTRKHREYKNLCTSCGEWVNANWDMDEPEAWWKPLVHRKGCKQLGFDGDPPRTLKALKLAAQDGGIYLIRGSGKRRYVGETISFARRRRTEIMLGASVRLIRRMPGSTKYDRLAEEARISELLISKGFVVLNKFKKPVMHVGPC